MFRKIDDDWEFRWFVAGASFDCLSNVWPMNENEESLSLMFDGSSTVHSIDFDRVLIDF